MLQENSITGLLFLIAIGINSVMLLVGSILAVSSALLVAHYWQANLHDYQKGLYGYNAALFGIVVFYFLPFSFTSVIFVIIGGVFSAAVMHFMLTKVPRIPVFTMPFILCSWLFILLINFLEIGTVVASGYIEANSFVVIDYFQISVRSIGQVMLQDYWLSGVVILLALFIHSKKLALWVYIGSIIGMLFAIVCAFPQDSLRLGLYGFNSCLVAIALIGRYPNRYLLILFAMSLCVAITRVFELANIAALTAPFVISTLLTMALVNHISNNFAGSKGAQL